MTGNNFKLRSVFILFVVSSIFLLANFVGAATYDATGEWNLSISNGWTDGGDNCPIEEDATITATITQMGDDVTVIVHDANAEGDITLNGSVNDSVYNLSGSWIEPDNETTVSGTFTLSSSTSGTGQIDISVTEGPITCDKGMDITLKKQGSTNNWVNIQGNVTHNGTPLCAMVLANGQYMFSCGENQGTYELEIPLDENGEITLFAFVDGLAPFKQILTPSEALDFDIEMELAGPDSKMPTVTRTGPESVDDPPGWVKFSGFVTLDGTPLCAMVLANGQYMFSCSGDGSYSLDVPLDGNGEITLFTFVDGLQPYKEIFSP